MGQSLSFIHFWRQLLGNYSFRRQSWTSYVWNVPLSPDTPNIWSRINWNLITLLTSWGEKLVFFSALTWDKMRISHESDFFSHPLLFLMLWCCVCSCTRKKACQKYQLFLTSTTDTIYAIQMEGSIAQTLLLHEDSQHCQKQSVKTIGLTFLPSVLV